MTAVGKKARHATAARGKARTCRDRVPVLQALRLHAHSQLDFETPGEALFRLPEGLQHEGLLVVSHHPETLSLPLVVGTRLANHVAEHVVAGVFFLQAVPETAGESF